MNEHNMQPFLEKLVKTATSEEKEALTLWISPAEWMYCSTGEWAGPEDMGEDREETEVKRASQHISSCLKEGCFCLLHGNPAGRRAAGPIQV